VSSSDLADERDLVRRLEAELAARYGVDTPAYWRAMSDRLHEYLTSPDFTQRRAEIADVPLTRGDTWITRVAAAYQALANG
jgi:hypothetical protein